MASVFARLSIPLVFVALACGTESPTTEDGDNGTGGFSGVAAGPTTGGANTSGSAGQGGTGQGGASGTTSGSAGQAPGGASPGGAGPGGAGVVGGDAGAGVTGGDAGASLGGAGSGGAPPGGMGGVGGAAAGAAGSLAGAPQGGAGSGDAYATGVTVTVHTEIRTMLNVTWTQAMAADQVYLEFTFETGNVMTSRPRPGTTGMKRDVVIGVPASTAVTVRVVSRAGGVDYKTRDYTGTTGALPSGMPVGQVMTYNAAIASPNRWLFGAVENSTGGCNSTQCFYHTTFWLYIMDRRGRMVWYYSDAASNATSSFQRIAKDGEYIWIEKRPFSGGGSRSVLKRTLDGTYSENIPIANLADCIDVTSDGSLLYDAQNVLRERTRAGQTRDIWSCRTLFPQGSCYTNTINWNARDNTVLMSYPERRTVVEVSRANGTVVGVYGADQTDDTYAFAATPAPPGGGSWEFGYQHFPNITKDGTLILSTHMPGYRTTNMPVAGQHAFEEYDINRTAKTLTMRWFFQAPGQEWAMYKGMAMKLANNNVLGNFGTGGIIREITPDKQTAFMVKFDAPPGTSQNNDFFNKMVGHNELIDDLYALNGGGPPP